MFDRTIGLDPRPAAPQSRAIYSMRDGHRREYDASRDRGSTSFRERCRGALADIGIYGALSVRDPAGLVIGSVASRLAHVSQPTLWGHASRVPGRGWRGACAPYDPPEVCAPAERVLMADAVRSTPSAGATVG